MHDLTGNSTDDFNGDVNGDVNGDLKDDLKDDEGQAEQWPEPRDRAALEALAASGRRVKFLHFWGHQPQADGSVGAGCLSQWWPAAFTVDGVAYATAEHWMMAGKARMFGDAEAEKRAVAASHPKEAKAVGREVRGFDEATWVAGRFALVVEGNVAKFGQHPDLRAFLLGTNTRILVEASPRDRIWGIGMSAAHEHADHPAHWRGQNLLGFALMETRARLRAQSEEEQGGTSRK